MRVKILKIVDGSLHVNTWRCGFGMADLSLRRIRSSIWPDRGELRLNFFVPRWLNASNAYFAIRKSSSGQVPK